MPQPSDREWHAAWLAHLLDERARDAETLAATLRGLADQARAVPTKDSPHYMPLACRVLRETQRFAAAPELPLVMHIARDADLAQAADEAAALDAVGGRPLTTVVTSARCT